MRAAHALFVLKDNNAAVRLVFWIKSRLFILIATIGLGEKQK